MFDPNALPDVAKPQDPIVEINRVGEQKWERSGTAGVGRYCTIQFFIPTGLDFETEWAAAVTPLLAKGMTMHETARQDIAEPLPEGKILKASGATHYQVSNKDHE